ncbi:MAG TPA: hypothetical protein VKB34_05670 [Povalibacter sp.]|nr:hypothetical protein [Povalibacter sp.]
MFDYNTDVVGGRVPVLAAPLLERIRQLNRDYIELLLAERLLPAPAFSGEALPNRLLDALAGLDVQARSALAACAYSLFSPGFDDQRFWTAVLCETATAGLASLADESVEARYGALSAAPMQAAFCEVTLFAAWHTAHAHRVAVRFLFGMPAEVAAKFIEAPLWQLRRIAIDYPGLLTPRWPTNPAFWPDLVRFAAAGDTDRLRATQLLGSQLIASELDGTLPRVRRRLRLKRS